MFGSSDRTAKENFCRAYNRLVLRAIENNWPAKAKNGDADYVNRVDRIASLYNLFILEERQLSGEIPDLHHYLLRRNDGSEVEPRWVVDEAIVDDDKLKTIPDVIARIKLTQGVFSIREEALGVTYSKREVFKDVAFAGADNADTAPAIKGTVAAGWFGGRMDGPRISNSFENSLVKLAEFAAKATVKPATAPTASLRDE